MHRKIFVEIILYRSPVFTGPNVWLVSMIQLNDLSVPSKLMEPYKHKGHRLLNSVCTEMSICIYMYLMLEVTHCHYCVFGIYDVFKT